MRLIQQDALETRWALARRIAMLNKIFAFASSAALTLGAASHANAAGQTQAAPTQTSSSLRLPSWLAWLGNGATPSGAGAAPAAAAAPLTAPAVVDRVQAFYVGIKQVSAKFRQSVTNATFGGDPKTNDGSVYIQKPGKMRWDYFTKKGSTVRNKKSFISNGAYLYVVEYDNKQILKKSLEKDLMPVAISFLYGKGDLKTDFTAELDASGKFGSKADLVLKLTPKKPSAQYKNLFLVVDPKDYQVTQSVIVDSSNNTNHFRFFSPNFEKPIQDAWFEFNEKSDAVKNFRLVDADQEDNKPRSSPSDLATPAPASTTRSAKPPVEMKAPQPLTPAAPPKQ
jgi:outer membrane lipoprotein carrier protein